MRHALVGPFVVFALGFGCAKVLGVSDVTYAGGDGAAGDGGGHVDGASGDAGPCARLACPSGACTPIPFAADTVNSLAIGHGAVYWVDAAGSILMQPTAGGAADKVQLASGSSKATITVDTDGTAFVTDLDAGTVSTCTTAGCTVIAKGLYRPRGIVIDDQYVYFGSEEPYPPPSSPPPNEGVFKVPKTGGTVVSLSSVANMNTFAIDDKLLFFQGVNGCDSYQLPKGTPGNALKLTPAVCDTQGLAVDHDAVYLAGREVQRIALRQGAWPGTISDVHATGATVDCAGDVYWSTQYALWRVAGSSFQQYAVDPPPDRVASGNNGEQVVADESGVYWATDDGIMKLAR